MTRISAEAGGDDRRAAGRSPNDTTSLVPPTTWSLQRLQRGLALLLDLDVDALAVEVVLQVGEARVGGVDDARARRRGSVEPGRRPGWRAATPTPPSTAKSAEVDERDGQRRAAAGPRCTSGTSGLRISAITPATTNSQQDLPGRARDDPEREDRERQHDELDPARDDDRAASRAASGGGGRSAGRARRWAALVGQPGSSCAQSMRRARRPRPSCSSATSWAASGRRTLLALLPGLRERLRADVRRRQRRERRRAASGSRPSWPTSCFAAGVDVDHARQPHLPPPGDLRLPRRAPSAILRPGELPAHPARATALRRRARRHAPRRRQPRGQRLPARRARRRSSEVDAVLERAARARPTTSSSTCTPRRPARRSRWAGTSTAASTAVVGTHTHVPTADARVLPGGTAYITDVGMTGPRGGVHRRQDASRRSSRCARR